LGGSLLVNVALLSYYVSMKQSDSSTSTSLLQVEDLAPAIKSTLSSLEQKTTARSSSKPPSPSSKARTTTVYDAAVNAEVDSTLLQGLAAANTLQVQRLVKREQALRAADAKLAKLTTANGNVRLPSPQPEHQAAFSHFEWGTVNPVSGLQRLTCSDSLADASGNSAPKNRLWGGPLAGKTDVEVDSCAPGQPCNDPCARSACNVGEVYTVECPSNCLKQELGGAVFGAGTEQNPFMDLSSVCRAALAAGVSNDAETNIVAFEVVDGAHSYLGASESKKQLLTTLDYSDVKPKYAGGSWYGVRAFKFVPASEAIQVSKRLAPGGEGSHMALSKRKSMLLAETGDAKMSQLAKLDGGQENMALYFDGTQGSMLTYEGAGAILSESITGGITVEAWVYDSQLGDRTGYVSFFQDMMGSPSSGGDDIWINPDKALPEEEKDYGFVLGTDQGAFSFGLASTNTNRLDYLSTQACACRVHSGSWVHIAGTYDGAVMKLFVDGELATEGFTQTGPISWPSDAEPAELTMGAWLGLDVQTYYKGMLDEVRIWSSALSGADIKANMHQTLAPPLAPAGLVMYWRFDRAYCDEINWILGKVAVTPGKDEMDLVPRVASGALVELQSVSWACLVECPTYTAPLHGAAYPTSVTHEGDTVSVSCDAGYEMRCGDDSDCATTTCQNDGENGGFYVPEGPAECIGICSSYPVVNNGEVTPAGQVYVDDMVEIVCKEGYELNADGNSPATCMDSGSGGMFDKMGAACIAVCDAYIQVPHGTVDPADPTRQNDQVTITCDEGYELVDSVVSGSPATCIDGGAAYGGGMYDKAASECRAKCTGYPAIEHGQVAPSGAVWVDTVVSIACKSGYVLGSGSPTSATCVDTGEGGDYDATGAECVAVCAAFPEVEFGTVSPSGEVLAGDVVSVVCDEGYVLAGDAAAFSTTCHDTGLGGEFDKEPPTCVEKPAFCAAVVIENGYVSPDADVREGSTLTVTCNEGFVFADDVATPFYATCIRDEAGGETVNGVDYGGVFDQDMPVCVPADGPTPPDPPDDVDLSMLNSRCATFRDTAASSGTFVQLEDYSKCMAQDCVQSMETGDDTPGCRFLDAHGFCFAYNSAQTWCAENVEYAGCNDGGTLWGTPPIGTAASVDAVEWTPQQGAFIQGTGADAGQPIGCQCMKNCACTKETCRCTDKNTRPVPALEGNPYYTYVFGTSEDEKSNEAKKIKFNAQKWSGSASGKWISKEGKMLQTDKTGECSCRCGIVGDGYHIFVTG